MFKPHSKKSRKGIHAAESGGEKGKKSKKRFFKKNPDQGSSEFAVNRSSPDREQGTILNIGTHKMLDSGKGLSGEIVVPAFDGLANKYAGVHAFVDPCFFVKWPELARLTPEELKKKLSQVSFTFTMNAILVEGPCQIDKKISHSMTMYVATDLKMVK